MGTACPYYALFVSTARLWLGREICLSISPYLYLYLYLCLCLSVCFEYSAGTQKNKWTCLHPLV